MPKYKNIGDRKIIIQAGANTEKPHIKKFYEIEMGQIVEIPVPLTRNEPNLELVSDKGEMRQSKKYRKGE